MARANLAKETSFIIPDEEDPDSGAEESKLMGDDSDYESGPEEEKKSFSDRVKASFVQESNFPDDWEDSDGEVETIEEGQPMFFGGLALKERAALTNLLKEEQNLEMLDEQTKKLITERFQNEYFKHILMDGIPVKRVFTQYFERGVKGHLKEVPQGNSEEALNARKEAVAEKTYTRKEEKVLYMLLDKKSLNWRGPKNPDQGFASPFIDTRSAVTGYSLREMNKPQFKKTTEHLYIRLTFKRPEQEVRRLEAAGETVRARKPKIIDLAAADACEFEVLKKGFYLLWKFHAFHLKLQERDPKTILRRAAHIPRNREELYDQTGYNPLVVLGVGEDGEIVKTQVAFGLSLEDVLLITAVMIFFYSSLLGIFGILLQASLDSLGSNFVMYSYFYFALFAFFVVCIKLILSGVDLTKYTLGGRTYFKNLQGVETVQFTHTESLGPVEVFRAVCRTLCYISYLVVNVLIAFFFVPLYLVWRFGMYNPYIATKAYYADGCGQKGREILRHRAKKACQTFWFELCGAISLFCKNCKRKIVNCCKALCSKEFWCKESKSRQMAKTNKLYANAKKKERKTRRESRVDVGLADIMGQLQLENPEMFQLEDGEEEAGY